MRITTRTRGPLTNTKKKQVEFSRYRRMLAQRSPHAEVPSAPAATSASKAVARASMSGARLTFRRGDPWRIVVVTLGFLALQWFGCGGWMFTPAPAVCFGIGLGLVAVLRYGYRMAIAVFLGSGAYWLLAGASIGISLASAVGEASIVIAAASFMHWRGFDWRLRRVEDVAMMCVGGMLVAAAAAALLHHSTLVAAGLSGGTGSAIFGWLTLWAAMAQGVLIGAPLAFAWLYRPRADRASFEALGLAVFAMTVLLFAPALLGLFMALSTARDAVLFALFPFGIWAAHRFAPREVVIVNLGVAIGALVDLKLGRGVGAGESQVAALGLFHGFIACFALATLVFAAVNTERRIGARALAASETRFRKLTELANDWYWEQDAALQFTLVSPGVAAIGVDRAAIVGKHFWDLPFAVSDAEWSAHRAVVESRRPFRDLLLTRRSATGESRYFVTSGDPMIDQHGKFAGYRGVVREITAERRAAEALRESEQRYASVFLNSSAAMLVLAIDESGLYRIESCNNSAEALFELSAQAMVGRTPEQCFEPGPAGEFLDRVRRCVVAYARITEEHALTVRSGAKYIVETLVPIRGGSTRVERVIVIAIDVTDQRRVEERARVSEQLFTQVFHANPTPIAFSRLADGRITEVNMAWLELFGTVRAGVVGRTLHELGVIGSSEAYHGAISAMLQSGSVRNREFRVQCQDGAALDILYSGELLEIGGETVVVSSVVDVSALKRHEDELRQAKDNFSKVFHSSPVPMIVSEYPERRYIELNDAWVEFFGFRREEAIGRTAVDLQIWPQALSEDLAWMDFISGKQVRNVEQRVRRKSGEFADVLISAELIELSGEARVITSIIDITQRKQTERLLQMSEARFRDFAEAAGEYVWETDLDWRFAFVSNRVEAVLGYRPAELEGRLMSEFAPPGEDQRLQQQIKAARRADGSFRNLEHRMLTKTGSTVWQLVNAVPMRDAGERVVGYRGTALDVTERKLAEQWFEELATHDQLTGLPNRRLFEEQLVRGTAHAQRTGQLAALLFIDLDRFKAVNDTLGHQIGDALLKEMARRLSAALRKGDTLSRFGGDEFVILLEGLRLPADAGIVAEKIVAEVGVPCEIEGHRLTVSCSIGLALFPNDATDVSTLMRYADAAMYAAKASGRDTYRFFSTNLHATPNAANKLGAELRVALDRGEFRVHYQPRVAIAETRVTAVAASLRWRHPQRGLLGPERFMRVAEEVGLARPLSEWLLENALAQLAQWRSVPELRIPAVFGFHGMPFTTSLVEGVRTALHRFGLDGEAIQIEVAEATVLRDLEAARANIEYLHGMGVKVLIDEFGSGYTTERYLRRLRVDGVKISASFVGEMLRSPEDRNHVRTLIEAARAEGVIALAEGVDSPEQLELLASFGCVEYAGRHYLAPVPPADFEQRALRATNISRLTPRRSSRV